MCFSPVGRSRRRRGRRGNRCRRVSPRQGTKREPRDRDPATAARTTPDRRNLRLVGTAGQGAGQRRPFRESNYLSFALVVLPGERAIDVGVFRTVEESTMAIRGVHHPRTGRGGTILEAMLVGNPVATLGHYHIAYSIGLQHGIVIIGFYIVATCGSMLVSGNRLLMWFGATNLVAVITFWHCCAPTASRRFGASTRRSSAGLSRFICG